MTDEIWDDFPETVEFRRGKWPMKRPTEKDLDAAERALEFRLPRSYRSFVKRFGAGVLTVEPCPCEWWIRAPGNPKNRFNASLEGYNKRFDAPPEKFREYCSDPARAGRLLFFAHSPLSLYDYGWDPEDVTDRDAPEYGVYSFYYRSLDPKEPVPRVAVSFYDFIMGYCLDRRPKQYGHTEAEWKEYGSIRSYESH